MKKYNSIVLTGGGTLGHVSPNLAILPDLSNTFEKIYYIGSENGIEKEKIESYNKQVKKDYAKVTYIPIQTVKLDRVKWYKNFLMPFKLFKGYSEAKKALKEINPDVIFSKGGFVAVPVSLASRKTKTPLVIHESDLTLGLANKVSAKSATTVCTTFQETAKKTVNGVYTGSPVNPKIFMGDPNRAKTKFNLNPNLKTVTVTGGSLGANAINSELAKILPKLANKYNIIHLTGKGKSVDFSYKNYHQIEFSDDIGSIFKASDLVISRAGSNTIFELASLKVPMLLIPLPKSASRGDQLDNAEYFKNLGIANVVFQEDLPTSLLESIENTMKSLNKLKKAYNKTSFPNGKQRILSEIYKAIDKNKK